ncbi:FG-GAP repeat protein [Marinicella rhabdoformis]|uniref:FG-GAP repeat protein n=1 Tax=Marinicella rhabdoformis TaxID=2580566 RepID=UPI0012AEBCCC|nr:FG-GAP repeat protein [Marinicella rhabdoformis]
MTHFNKIKLLFVLLISSIQVTAYADKSFPFDQQRPSSVSDKNWASLKAAVQEAKLIPILGNSADHFGSSVSIEGTRALIGAKLADESGNLSGSAYVFELVNDDWIQTTQLIPTDGGEFDRFGYSVSLSGDRALIGAYFNQNNNISTGSAYVFELIDGDWVQTSKLFVNDATSTEYFGWSVSLQGDRALVGAQSGRVNGINTGSAYVFDFINNNWIQSSKLTATDGLANDRFGFSLSLGYDKALIGATENSVNGTKTGAAYIFDFDGALWSQTSKLIADDGTEGDQFGNSVVLSNNRAVIGARYDDETGNGSGSAYVFDYNEGMWSQPTKLSANDAAPGNIFGASVAAYGDKIIIGASNLINNGVGAAYLFELDQGIWNQTNKFTPNDGANGDSFGIAVSMNLDRVLVGSSLNIGNNIDSGSAYVFNLDPQYKVTGQITGLAFENSIVIQNNGTDDLFLDSNGAFTFATKLSDETNYEVSVLTQPNSPNQTCTISNPIGVINGSDVFVNVVCTTDTYFIGGQVSGLFNNSTVVLQNNMQDDTVITCNGPFVFTTSLDDLSSYSATILSQPQSPIGECMLSQANGMVSGDDVISIELTCEYDTAGDFLFRNGFDGSLLCEPKPQQQ